MHDGNIRARLLAAMKDTLGNAPGIDVRRLPRPVRPLASRRFLESLKPSAVLVGIVDDPQRMTVLLTERNDSMRAHAGQVSFPGGRMDEGDGSYTATATREAQEEINLSPQHVQPIGQLGSYPTVTGFSIAPIVALIDPRARRHLKPSPAEVQQIIELPLRHVLHAQHFQRGWLRRGQLRLPYQSLHWRGITVWGATAAILSELSRRLRQ